MAVGKKLGNGGRVKLTRAQHGEIRPRRRLRHRWRSTWGRFRARLLAVQPLLASLAVLALRRLLVVLAVQQRIPPMDLAVLGLLALRGILAGRCFLVVLGVRVVLERGFLLRVLELLAILAVRWVLVGLGVLAVLLGMACMGMVQQSGTQTERAFLAGRGCLDLLGCRGVLAGRAVLALRVLLQSSTRSRIHRRRQSDGQCGCGPLGWT